MNKPKLKTIAKPNLSIQDTTSPRNIYKSGGSSSVEDVDVVGFPNIKRNVKAVAGATSLLRAIPTPITQVIGWGASAVSAGMDVKDAYDSGKKGNYGDAALSLGGAALDVVPLGKIAGYVKKPGKIMLAKGLKQLTKLDRVKNFGSSVLQKAAVLNDVKDAVAPVAVKSSRKVLPINAAMLAQDIMGDKESLTEKDLKSDELNVLRSAARSAKKNAPLKAKDTAEMGYSDYKRDSNFRTIYEAIKRPAARMRTTIGGATIKGNTLTDEYDFNRDKKDNNDFDIKTFNSKPGSYNKLRYVAGRLGSKIGEGIPSNIKLGNLKRPTKDEETTGIYAKGTSGIQVGNPTTKLKPGQEVAYNQWRTNNKIEESDDYDLKGYWKETGYKSASHDGHFPDTYKLKAPFSEGDRYQQISDESKYSGNPGYLSGTNTSFDKRGQGTWTQTENKNDKPLVGPGNSEDKFEAYAQGTQAISILPSGSKTQINTMKQPYKMKSKKLQKAAGGLNDVAVPEAGNMGNVLSSGLSMGAAGAEVGGPWGAVVGGVVGVGMGLYQKDKQDAANKQALINNTSAKVNRSYNGIDVTANQKEQTYAQGTTQMKAKKTIEVEGDEHHFDSELNHKGVYKGASHAKGGIVTDVEEGDVIIPKKHKGLVDKALKVGDFKKIDKLRKTLPKDTPDGKAALGLDNTDPNTNLDEEAYAKRNKSLKSPSLFGRPQYADATNRRGQYNYNRDIVNGENGGSTWLAQGEKGNPNAYGVSVANKTNTMYRDDSMPKIQPTNIQAIGGVPTQTGQLPTNLEANASYTPLASSGTGTQDMANESNPVGNLAKYANIGNNLIQGFTPPKPIEQSYLDPELLKYTDRSETLRRASRQGEAVQNSNARNASGGMVGNLRANQAANNTENMNRQEGINETEMQRADVVDNTNVGIKNNARQVNLGRKDLYQDQMMKARAVQESYRDAATSEVAQRASKNEQDGYLRSRDGKLDQLERDKLNSENQWRKYESDARGNISFKSNGQGGSNPGASTPQVTKSVSVGTNGKTSTRTTTKSAAPLRMKANSPIKRRK